MPQQELVKAVITALTQTGIEHMMTGSIVSSLQGEPRLTHDIDIIITIPPSHVEKFLQCFPFPNYYLSREAALDAIRLKSTFNVISNADGYKVDFWLLTDEPFDRSRFARKYQERIGDLELWVSAPEDTILAKLRWGKELGGSEKQFVDALRVYELQYSRLDQNYLRSWARQLDVAEELERLMKEAAP